MQGKRIITASLLVFVAASLAYLGIDTLRSRSQPTAAQADAGPDRVIAYYFHGTQRCHTCLTIEAYTGAAIQAGFGDELASGRLEWRVVNIDEPENEHFVRDFGLTTRSVVLVEIRDGKPAAWRNLDQVWELVSYEQEFTEYIQAQTRDFLDHARG
jgi:hypothetical protein